MAIEKSYTVTQVQRLPVPSPNGEIMDMVRVSFRSPRGYTSKVEIPFAQATEAAIRAAIEKDIAWATSVYNL
jgi:hypothetical protein